MAIGAILHEFVDGVSNINDHLADLKRELDGLSRVLSAIESCERGPLAGLTERKIDGLDSLVTSLSVSMADCRETLEKLEAQFTELTNKKGFLGWAGRPGRQIRLNLQAKNNTMFRQLIHSHTQDMHLAMGFINLCLQYRGNASVDKVLQALHDLESKIGSLAIKGPQQGSKNRVKLQATAQDFYSNMSDIVEGSVAGDRDYNPSLDGFPLGDRGKQKIQDWIPPPPSVAPERHSLDSDDELDVELAKKFEELALSSFKSGDYGKAVEFFFKILPADQEYIYSDASFMLAFCQASLGKWDLIGPVLSATLERPALQPTNPLFGHLLHGMALHQIMLGQNDDAFIYCRKAMKAKAKLPAGRTNESYAKSLQLLAFLYEQKGDSASREACRELLPADMMLEDHRDFRSRSDYMKWAADFEKRDTPPFPVEQPMPTPAKSPGDVPDSMPISSPRPPSLGLSPPKEVITIILGIDEPCGFYIGFASSIMMPDVDRKTGIHSGPQPFNNWPATYKDNTDGYYLKGSIKYNPHGKVMALGDSAEPDMAKDDGNANGVIDLRDWNEKLLGKVVWPGKTFEAVLADFYLPILTTIRRFLIKKNKIDRNKYIIQWEVVLAMRSWDDSNELRSILAELFSDMKLNLFSSLPAPRVCFIDEETAKMIGKYYSLGKQNLLRSGEITEDQRHVWVSLDGVKSCLIKRDWPLQLELVGSTQKLPMKLVPNKMAPLEWVGTAFDSLAASEARRAAVLFQPQRLDERNLRNLKDRYLGRLAQDHKILLDEQGNSSDRTYELNYFGRTHKVTFTAAEIDNCLEPVLDQVVEELYRLVMGSFDAAPTHIFMEPLRNSMRPWLFPETVRLLSQQSELSYTKILTPHTSPEDTSCGAVFWRTSQLEAGEY
ncbi:hypothetical protein B0H66DRAFT_618706 [Apodospora peruviana]|uniref:Fungal N-terminal domain-containing protein n=1 Tax=Apodospora peruviana TaxID=516989 RepID=A0AAE0M713_9PEZI|nr:hypothetical protein B0H66DRAFT_618706 [Apodospora peruviana]